MKLKQKFMCLCIVATMIICSNSIVFAQNIDKNDELSSAYMKVIKYAKNINVNLEMTFNDFITQYNQEQFKTIDEFVDYYCKALHPQKINTYNNYINVNTLNTYYSNYFTKNFNNNDSIFSVRSGGGSPWYYNTGKTLPQKPDYSRYNLLNIVKPGDIIYEAKGGYGITGHALIVEGIFYSAEFNQKYIRVIEAISAGVCYSVLDANRIDDRHGSIYRVKNANSNCVNNAVRFCVGEIGSSYCLDLAKDFSSKETDWYCSELVWAGYKNQQIDIEVGGFHGEPGVTPRDITTKSSKVINIPLQ